MNRLTTNARRVAVVFAVLVLAGCSNAAETDDDFAGLKSGECKTGANAAWATPAGTSFSLPAGVEVSGDINGNVVDPPCSMAPTVEYGGDLLPACLTLKNTSNAEITVKLPAGLVFLAKDAATQNGIILQDHDLVIPAGETKSFRFSLYCLNEHCLFGEKATLFTFGNVSNDPLMVELVGLARGRKMTNSATGTASTFGAAIWDITGGRGLGAERRKQIADLADGS